MNIKRQSQFRGATLSAVLALSAACQAPSAHAQASAYPTDLTNIASAQNGGTIIGATSILNNDAKFGAANLLDGKVYDAVRNKGSEGWVSNKFDPQDMDSITLGFANNSVHRIGKIVFNPSSSVAPERWAKDVEVQVSTQTAEGPYSKAAEITLRKSPENQEFLILPIEARFVRLNFRSNWGSDRAVALGEVEIYEAIPTNDPLGQLIARYQGAVEQLKKYRQTQIEGGNGTSFSPARARNTDTPTTLDGASLQDVQLATGTAGGELPVASRNIASAKNGGKIMDVTSVFSDDPQYGADKLIDGQLYDLAANSGSRGWASQGFLPGKQSVTLGFAGDRTRLIGKIVMNPVSAQPNLRWARRVNVEVTTGSALDGPYRTVTTLTLRPEPTNQEFPIRSVEAKYVRFTFTANGPGDVILPGTDPDVNSDRAVSLGEIEVYEATATGDELDSLIGRFNQILVDLINLRRQNLAVKANANAANLPNVALPDGGAAQVN